MRRVLVTRPEPGASRTATELRRRGFEPVVLPLSKTTALPVDLAMLPDGAAAVAVTSANALRHAPPALLERLKPLSCHAVGDRTAEAARAAGFRTISTGPGDALAMAAAIAPGLEGKDLIYLCGRVRVSGFEERLAAGGVSVRPIEIYDIVAMHYSDEDVIACLEGEAVDAVLLYSARVAEAAEALFARPRLGRLIKNASVFALSPRVAAGLGGGRTIGVAGVPDEPALLALLSPPA